MRYAPLQPLPRHFTLLTDANPEAYEDNTGHQNVILRVVPGRTRLCFGTHGLRRSQTLSAHSAEEAKAPFAT